MRIEVAGFNRYGWELSRLITNPSSRPFLHLITIEDASSSKATCPGTCARTVVTSIDFSRETSGPEVDSPVRAEGDARDN